VHWTQPKRKKKKRQPWIQGMGHRNIDALYKANGIVPCATFSARSLLSMLHSIHQSPRIIREQYDGRAVVSSASCAVQTPSPWTWSFVADDASHLSSDCTRLQLQARGVDQSVITRSVEVEWAVWSIGLNAGTDSLRAGVAACLPSWAVAGSCCL
jgi:hypothetical protein